MRSSDGNNNETAGIVLFFCAIILALFFYLPAETTGVAGNFIKSIGFGLLGISAHIIPVFLIYASIDLFLEKRAKVARFRVGTVIFLMICISAIFAAFTMDFEYFKLLCFDIESSKTTATKAISLLWKSGMNSEIISKPEDTLLVIPGGLFGGLIATSIQAVCGRIVTCILLIGFTIIQAILIFRISVKNTAKEIKNVTKRKINNYKQERDNRGKASAHTKGIIPDNVYANARLKNANIPSNNTVRITPEMINRPAPVPTPVNTSTSFNNPAVTEVPIFNGNPIPVEEDPFNVHSAAMPVDRATGFINLDGDNGEFTASVESKTISYEDKSVSVNDVAYSADFSYTARPKNPSYTPLEPMNTNPFVHVKPGVQKEFYQLVDDNPYNDKREYHEVVSEDPRSYEAQSVSSVIEEDDMPFEITGEVESENAHPARISVRTPFVPTDLFANKNEKTEETPVQIKEVEKIVYVEVEKPVEKIVESTPVQESSAISISEQKPKTVNKSIASNVSPITVSAEEINARDDITINAPSSTEGVASEGGRQIDIVSSVNTEPSVPDINEPRRTRAKFSPAPTRLLSGDPPKKNANSDEALKAKAIQLEEALRSFGIEAKVINITHGPAITRFELTIKVGTKVSRVLSLTDDIQLSMAATSVRIEAPIPGKSAIGIEIPNEFTTAVHLRNLLETQEFRNSSPLTVALGRDIPGKPILCDLAKMPHLLVAGSTGSGKSVCINSILLSILCKESPENVRLILIDPKQVELSIYNGIPHLITPVVVDPKKATNALKWAVKEMNERYAKFAEAHVRNMGGYNEKAESDPSLTKMPLILLVIDEFADIMTVAAKEVEEQVMRLAAMARAAGIHMILATQRPSVDVITGVLKNNMPSRIAFAVTSGVDSRTILDAQGAEKLLGKGDMLYAPQSLPKPIRGQGAFVPDSEVESIIEYLKRFGTNYDNDVNAFINSVSTDGGPSSAGSSSGGASGDAGGEDELLEQAVDIVIDAKVASVSILQRKLGIGYPRAARLIDVMEEKHYIGPFEGSKPRRVLINKTDWLEIKSKK